MTSRLAAGQVTELKDEAQDEKNIARGARPEPGPEYRQSLDASTDAHVEVSTCTSHRPGPVTRRDARRRRCGRRGCARLTQDAAPTTTGSLTLYRIVACG